jgi:hypothetical protein
MKSSARRRLPVLALLVCTPLFVSYSGDVDAERADASAVSSEAVDPAVCESPAELLDLTEQRIAEAARRVRNPDAARDVIVLNNQGYNYAAGPARELEEIQRALAAERDAAGR